MSTAPAAKTANATENSTTSDIYSREPNFKNLVSNGADTNPVIEKYKAAGSDQDQVDDQTRGRGHHTEFKNGPQFGKEDKDPHSRKEYKDGAFGQRRGDQSKHETGRQGDQDNFTNETPKQRGKDDSNGPGLEKKDETLFNNSKIKHGHQNSSGKGNIGDCGPNRKSREELFDKDAVVVVETDPVNDSQAETSRQAETPVGDSQAETPVGDSQAETGFRSSLLNDMIKVRFEAKIACACAWKVVVPDNGFYTEKFNTFVVELLPVAFALRSYFFNSLPTNKVYHGYPPLAFKDVTFTIDNVNLTLYLYIETLLIDPPKTDDFVFRNLGRENDPNFEDGEMYKSLIDREIVRKDLEKLRLIASLLNVFKTNMQLLSRWAFMFHCPDKEFSLNVSLPGYVGTREKEFTDDYKRLMRGFLYSMKNDASFFIQGLSYNHYKDFDFDLFFKNFERRPSTPWSSTDEESDIDEI